jgi:GAF domain-containing protein
MESPLQVNNPLLPETRSELALALKVGDQIIGALDVQSREANSFASGELQILQTISDQLAVAIDKATLMDKLQSNLKEMENISREATKNAWTSHLSNKHKNYSYRYRTGLLDQEKGREQKLVDMESSVEENPEVKQARQSEKLVITKISLNETAIAIPIKLRQEVLGILGLRFASGNISNEVIDLLEATCDRMALALENARLLEDIQLRADRDHLVSLISEKVRSTSGVDGILRTAAAELGARLGVSEITVQLRKQA